LSGNGGTPTDFLISSTGVWYWADNTNAALKDIQTNIPYIVTKNNGSYTMKQIDNKTTFVGNFYIVEYDGIKKTFIKSDAYNLDSITFPNENFEDSFFGEHNNKTSVYNYELEKKCQHIIVNIEKTNFDNINYMNRFIFSILNQSIETKNKYWNKYSRSKIVEVINKIKETITNLYTKEKLYHSLATNVYLHLSFLFGLYFLLTEFLVYIFLVQYEEMIFKHSCVQLFDASTTSNLNSLLEKIDFTNKDIQALIKTFPTNFETNFSKIQNILNIYEKNQEETKQGETKQQEGETKQQEESTIITRIFINNFENNIKKNIFIFHSNFDLIKSKELDITIKNFNQLIKNFNQGVYSDLFMEFPYTKLESIKKKMVLEKATDVNTILNFLDSQDLLFKDLRTNLKIKTKSLLLTYVKINDKAYGVPEQYYKPKSQYLEEVKNLDSYKDYEYYNTFYSTESRNIANLDWYVPYYTGNQRFNFRVSTTKESLKLQYYNLPFKTLIYKPKSQELLESIQLKPEIKKYIDDHQIQYKDTSFGHFIPTTDLTNETDQEVKAFPQVLHSIPTTDLTNETDEKVLHSNNEQEMTILDENTFYLGNFTKVFSVEDTNDIMANQLIKDLEPAIKEKKPIFILGYGSSGSGKTSTLINLSFGVTSKGIPGVVIQLLKYLDTTYEENHSESIKLSIKLSIKEFQDNTEKNYKLTDISNLIFYKSGDTWLTDGITDITSLTDVIKLYIEKQRIVKWTPNNPISSRSHVLFYLQAFGQNIFVGDFAGLENTFDPNDYQTIENFINARTITDGTETDKSPYNDTFINYNNHVELLKDNILDKPLKNSLNSKEVISQQIKNIDDIIEMIKKKNELNQHKQNLENIKINKEIFLTVSQILINNNLKTTPKLIIKDDNSHLKNYKHIELLEKLNDYFINGKRYERLTNYDSVFFVTQDQIDNNIDLSLVNDALKGRGLKVFDFKIPQPEKDNKTNVVKLSTTPCVYSDEKIIEFFVYFFKTEPKIKFQANKTKDKKENGTLTVHKIVSEGELNETFQNNKIYKEIMDEKTKQKPRNKKEKVTTKEIETLNLEKTNELITIIDEYDGNNLDKLKEILLASQKICIERKKEWEYINKSLKHLRKSLIDIIHYKNSGSTILLPDTINGCYYCDEESNSCLTKQRTINENPVSLIQENEFFQWMFNCLNHNNYEPANFCNDLIICIFCTFNNSRTADPPKIPYVNINKYKKNFYKFMNKYGECLTSDYDKVFKEKNEYGNPIDEFKQNIQNCLKRVQFLIQTLFSEQLKQTFTIADFSLNEDLFTISQNFQKYIKTIDTWNEATSIGTLEFMDIFCKFNSTQYLCDKVTSSDVIYEPLYKPFTTIKNAKDLFK
jgi:hypothetical protein